MPTNAKVFPELFAASAQAYGDTAAIEETDRTLSYADLNALRLDVARSLIAHGIAAGDRVAIWAPNVFEWIAAAQGLQTIGAALVPINTRNRGEETAHILEAANVKLVFCIDEFLGVDYTAMLDAHRPDCVQNVVVLRTSRNDVLGWEQFLAKGADIPVSQVDDLAQAVTPDTISDIMFTSGTTGKPKGVMTSHGQNLKVIHDWSSIVGVREKDPYLIVNPFFHAFGYKAGWMAALMHGATVLPETSFDVPTVLKRIEERKVAILPGPPTLFIGLLDHPERTNFDVSSLRVAVTGAAAISPTLIRRMFDDLGLSTVLTGYGLTECSGFVTLASQDYDVEALATTSGHAMPDIEVRCIDGDGQPVPVDEPGEVVVRGYNVMQGYLDNAEETAKTIDADGWLHTGDLGILDVKGRLRITDRLKDMIIVGGFNCYPAEVERIMAGHPDIAQVAVVGVADERLGEVPKAFVIAKPGKTPDEAEIISWCREHMANYKAPRTVEIVDALPTNASGKVQKFALRT